LIEGKWRGDHDEAKGRRGGTWVAVYSPEELAGVRAREKLVAVENVASGV
jgi:hypothetical protein